MVEKNGIAKLIDGIADAAAKKRKDSQDNENDCGQAEIEDLNILPKPDEQIVGDGIMVWRWYGVGVTVESVYAVRDGNELQIPADTYLVSAKLPAGDGSYVFRENSAMKLGQFLLSAYNWKNIWEKYTGELLKKSMLAPTVRPPVEFVSDEEQKIQNQDVPEVYSNEGELLMAGGEIIRSETLEPEMNYCCGDDGEHHHEPHVVDTGL